MNRTEEWRIVKMCASALVAGILYLQSHNEPAIIPPMVMLALGTIAAALVAVQAYLSTPPTGVKVPDKPPDDPEQIQEPGV